MGEQRKYKGYVVAAVIAGVLASCTGSHSGAGSGTGSGSGTASGPGSRSDDGSHAPLSVGRVKEMAADPGETCPVPFDMAAAAKSARIGERIRAGTVSGETADKSDPSAPLTLFKGALVSCGYGIGKEKAHVFTVGVGKGTAVGVLLPQVQHDAGMAMTELKAYAAEASKAPMRQARAHPQRERRLRTALRRRQGRPRAGRLPRRGQDRAHQDAGHGPDREAGGPGTRLTAPQRRTGRRAALG